MTVESFWWYVDRGDRESGAKKEKREKTVKEKGC
jgi:hypothetical protein